MYPFFSYYMNKKAYNKRRIKLSSNSKPKTKTGHSKRDPNNGFRFILSLLYQKSYVGNFLNLNF